MMKIAITIQKEILKKKKENFKMKLNQELELKKMIYQNNDYQKQGK
jgi:hypothetical protein